MERFNKESRKAGKAFHVRQTWDWRCRTETRQSVTLQPSEPHFLENRLPQVTRCRDKLCDFCVLCGSVLRAGCLERNEFTTEGTEHTETPIVSVVRNATPPQGDNPGSASRIIGTHRTEACLPISFHFIWLKCYNVCRTGRLDKWVWEVAGYRFHRSVRLPDGGQGSTIDWAPVR